MLVRVCVWGVASASVYFMAIKHVEFCRFICQSGAQLKTQRHGSKGAEKEPERRRRKTPTMLRSENKKNDEYDAEIVLNPKNLFRFVSFSLESTATLWGSRLGVTFCCFTVSK